VIQCGADGIPSQVQTAHGGVLVANTHLVSPHLREGNMQTASRSLMFNTLIKKVTQLAGLDGDFLILGDMNWNDEKCATPHPAKRVCCSRFGRRPSDCSNITFAGL
jgi:hypothetical protein